MFNPRFLLDAAERMVRVALIMFLTTLLTDSFTDASIPWSEKLIAAGLAAGMSAGLSLLSMLRDTDNASFMIKDRPDEPSPVGGVGASPK